MRWCDGYGRADRDEEGRNERAGGSANRGVLILILTSCLPQGVAQLC